MSSHNQVLELTNRHQLIDLNKEKVNFKVSFNVISDPVGEEFEAIVMNQNDLNNYSKLQDIQMKVAPGKIGGTIVADNNTYQNYFLILKNHNNEKNVNVKLSYQIEDVPAQETPTEVPHEVYEEQSLPESNEVLSKFSNETPIYRRVWFWIIFAVGVAVLGYLCFDYIKNRRDGYHNQIKKALLNANHTQPTMDSSGPQVAGDGSGFNSDQVLHDNMSKIIADPVV